MSHDFPYNIPVSIQVANESIVQHMATKGNPLQCQCSCQKFSLEGLSQECPMTFPTMFPASSVFKSCKRKHSAAFGNYSGSGRLGSGRLGSARLTCDYKAISVQLQLQLPTGTELGNGNKLKSGWPMGGTLEKLRVTQGYSEPLRGQSVHLMATLGLSRSPHTYI